MVSRGQPGPGRRAKRPAFVPNSRSTDAGDYHVVVSNQAGTETSDTATLFVVVPPAITQLTDQVSVVEGDTLRIVCHGSGY